MWHARGLEEEEEADHEDPYAPFRELAACCPQSHGMQGLSRCHTQICVLKLSLLLLRGVQKQDNSTNGIVFAKPVRPN